MLCFIILVLLKKILLICFLILLMFLFFKIEIGIIFLGNLLIFIFWGRFVLLSNMIWLFFLFSFRREWFCNVSGLELLRINNIRLVFFKVFFECLILIFLMILFVLWILVVLISFKGIFLILMYFLIILWVVFLIFVIIVFFLCKRLFSKLDLLIFGWLMIVVESFFWRIFLCLVVWSKFFISVWNFCVFLCISVVVIFLMLLYLG